MGMKKCPVCEMEFDSWRSMRTHQGKIGHISDSNHKLDTESHIERYRRIGEEIPDKYSDAYESMTGRGKSPVAFQATVCYIETILTMDEVADEFDTNAVTIRENVEELIERGVVPLEYVRENCVDNGLQVFGEKRLNGEKSVNLHS